MRLTGSSTVTGKCNLFTSSELHSLNRNKAVFLELMQRVVLRDNQ